MCRKMTQDQEYTLNEKGSQANGIRESFLSGSCFSPTLKINSLATITFDLTGHNADIGH